MRRRTEPGICGRAARPPWACRALGTGLHWLAQRASPCEQGLRTHSAQLVPCPEQSHAQRDEGAAHDAVEQLGVCHQVALDQGDEQHVAGVRDQGADREGGGQHQVLSEQRLARDDKLGKQRREEQDGLGIGQRHAHALGHQLPVPAMRAWPPPSGASAGTGNWWPRAWACRWVGARPASLPSKPSLLRQRLTPSQIRYMAPATFMARNAWADMARMVPMPIIASPDTTKMPTELPSELSEIGRAHV